MTIVRRVGTSPASRGSVSGANCPDVLELHSGDFMVIGNAPGVPNIRPAEMSEHGASIGPGEQAVIVPREVLLAAARDLMQEG
ncbi:hypothetical protein OG352_05495 [Streptomyces sp. NBC_01485]|uniref:hypothetical protein n=1 Tax=Streptomyces sp. NBC_01485 TaxID=2903884 RepID=UPI002E338855|nr:hypothetical protein [Streptomyces sp. NBC_01485]